MVELLNEIDYLFNLEIIDISFNPVLIERLFENNFEGCNLYLHANFYCYFIRDDWKFKKIFYDIVVYDCLTDQKR
mgnify:CR=1 FL=1